MATPPAQFVMDVVSQVQEQVQRYMTHSGQHHAWRCDSVTLDDVMISLPDVDDDRTVDIVLYACLQSCSRSCASLAAVRYDRVEMLLRSAPSLVPELEDAVWGAALEYLKQNDCWQSIQALLARGTGRVCWNLLGREAAASSQDHPAAVAVFDMLAARCLQSECSCISGIVNCVTWMGSVDWFKTLVNSKNNTIRRFVSDHVVKLIFNTSVYRQCPDTHPGTNLNGCLAVACEAGLFTARVTDQSSPLDSAPPHTAMGWAVYVNQPDLVRFCYHAGATDNRDLFQLSRDTALEAKAKADPANVPQSPTPPDEDYPTFTDADAANNIQGFLSTVASTPRTLESMCLLQVSRQLGWGHGRESKVEELNIAPTLKQDLKFKDHKALLKYPNQK